MNIRVMTIEDYDAVYRLWTDTPGMGLNPVDDSRGGIARFLARNPGLSFVAETEDGLAGVLLCGHDGRRAFLYHAAVRPEHRGGGIGRALVEAALAALRREGIRKAALVAFRTNELGNGFWAAMGFSERSDLTYRNISLADGNAEPPPPEMKK